MLQNFCMKGTSGEGDYVVIAYTDRGRIGLRSLFPLHDHRIRIEPEESAIYEIAGSLEHDWTPPDGYNIRFSRYTTNNKALQEAMIDGLKALKGKTLAINPEAPEWARHIAKKYSAPEQDEKAIFIEASQRLLAQFRQSLR